MKDAEKDDDKQIEYRLKDVIDAYVDVEEYFYTITHELKSPLREIDLLAKFISEDNAGVLLSQSLDDLQSIRRLCDKMVYMIQGIMDYSKAGNKILNRKIFNMKTLVMDCYSSLVKVEQNRNIKIDVRELPEIIADMSLVQLMVINILKNSIKFTQNVENPVIKVYSYEEGGEVSFCFEDNGIGFDVKHSSSIFEIFERMHNGNDYEGHGLGLAAVKKIVARFGGSVEIFGRVNKGCTVTVKFPKSMVIPVEKSLKAKRKKEETISIGIIVDSSGDYSSLAPGKEAAFKLAAEEINESGGILGKKVELIFKDCKSDLALSAELAWQLVEVDKVDVLMNGQLSSVREEIRRVIDETKTLYFFEAPYEGGVADHYTFCPGPVPEQNLYPMLDYLLKRYGKKCYILSADYNYGILMAECAKYYIEKNGGSIIGVEYFQTTKSRFGVTIENIKEMNPDILLSFCVGENQKHFFEQWIESGIKGMPIVSTIGIVMTHLHKVFSHIPSSIENVYCMTSFIEDFETPQAKAFKDKIRSRHSFDEVPFIGCDAEHVYTTMYLYKNAVEAAGTVETECVIKALESGSISFNGPGGPVRVRGEDHHVSRDMKLVRISRDNEVEILAEYPALHSDYVEKALEKETGIKGGLQKLGLNAPNIQYNLMFHRIF